MEEIIRVENEIVLNILENGLTESGIEYLAKKLDISNLPVNTNDYAVILSESKNRAIICEIYNNIKYSQKNGDDNNEKMGYNIPKQIFKVFGFLVLIVIIIVQQVVIQNNHKALTVSRDEYTYKWSSDLRETQTYRKDGYYLQKSIDNDRNNVAEKVEMYLPNGIVEIYEDNNQNSFFEKCIRQKDGIKLNEGISTNDDGIYDKWYYYKNGEISQIIIYDAEQNIIRIAIDEAIFNLKEATSLYYEEAY